MRKLLLRETLTSFSKDNPAVLQVRGRTR